jgi:NADPH-dependent 2,4-dienoyl-CoA reductase/sulfur reductase-like enzyme
MALERCDVAVVGAGPYGLSTAAHLGDAGVDVHTFGGAMEFWDRNMPRGMLLRSAWEASHIAHPTPRLSLDAYENASGRSLQRPVPLEDFVEYGLWYQREAVPTLDARRVEQVERDDGGFELVLSDGGRFRARRVVVATGLERFAWRPSEFLDLPPALASHTADHRDLAHFAGRRVAVLGAGQSAVESAALLAEAGAEVELFARRPTLRWLPYARTHARLRPVRALLYPPTDVGPPPLNWIVALPELYSLLPGMLRGRVAYRCVRPAAAEWLRHRVQGVRLTTGRKVARATPAGDGLNLELTGGGDRQVDHLLLATGYRVDISRLTFLSEGVSRALAVSAGSPVLSRGFESSFAGLYFVGAAAAESFGPIMRFVVGTTYAARAVRQHVLDEPQPNVAETVRAYARRRERVHAAAIT